MAKIADKRGKFKQKPKFINKKCTRAIDVDKKHNMRYNNGMIDELHCRRI